MGMYQPSNFQVSTCHLPRWPRDFPELPLPHGSVGQPYARAKQADQKTEATMARRRELLVLAALFSWQSPTPTTTMHEIPTPCTKCSWVVCLRMRTSFLALAELHLLRSFSTDPRRSPHRGGAFRSSDIRADWQHHTIWQLSLHPGRRRRKSHHSPSISR